MPANDRPSSSAVRVSPTTGARRPRWPHSGQAQASSAAPHHRQVGGAVAEPSASGPVQTRQRAGGAAALAGEGRGVAAARGLHEHRPGRQRVADRVVHLGRQPGGPGEGIPGQRVLVGARDRDGDPGPQLLAGGGELVRPARADQLLGLDAHREAPDQRGRPLALGTQQQGLAGVRVRRPRLGVQVVAVVPDHHEAEACDRRERRGAGADHDPPATAGDGEEVAVALRRSGVRGEHDVLVGTEHRGQRGVDLRDVLAVRHDDQRAAAARDGGRDGVRDERRPVGAGGGAPHRPRRPAVGQVPRGTRARARGRPRRPRPRRSRRPAAAPERRSPSSRWPRAGPARPAAARRSGCRRSARPASAASAATCGDSTGSALTTRRSGVSDPSWSVPATRSSTKPSTSRPANRTLTRTPGRASSAIDAGTA